MRKRRGRCNLAGADFTGAQLPGAVFDSANLEGAVISANLAGARLCDVNLTGASAYDANLFRATLGRRARWRGIRGRQQCEVEFYRATRAPISLTPISRAQAHRQPGENKHLLDHGTLLAHSSSAPSQRAMAYLLIVKDADFSGVDFAGWPYRAAGNQLQFCRRQPGFVRRHRRMPRRLPVRPGDDASSIPHCR